MCRPPSEGFASQQLPAPPCPVGWCPRLVGRPACLNPAQPLISKSTQCTMHTSQAFTPAHTRATAMLIQ